jgi:diguanylate cyclase (GGDEF)-like protein/PAS domain S-box-containing protein
MTMGTRMLPGWGAEGGGEAAKVVHTGDLLDLHPSLAAALDACPTALIMLDAEQHFVRVNAAACAFLGRTHDDLLGVCAVDLLAPEMTIENETGPDAAATALDPAAEADWCFEKPDHSLVWGRVRIVLLGAGDRLSAARLTMIDDVTEEHRALASERALMGDLNRYQRMFGRGSIGQLENGAGGAHVVERDADGVSMGALAVITDVTERQRATEWPALTAVLEWSLALHVARHDPMTGLPLRATLIEHLHRIIGIEHRPCVALLMDVDDLQVVNEALGHDAGDAVLVRIASSLVAAFPGMMVARVGGDEFVVSAPDITRDEPIDELVSRVRTALSTGHADQLASSLRLAGLPE